MSRYLSTSSVSVVPKSTSGLVNGDVSTHRESFSIDLREGKYCLKKKKKRKFFRRRNNNASEIAIAATSSSLKDEDIEKSRKMTTNCYTQTTLEDKIEEEDIQRHRHHLRHHHHHHRLRIDRESSGGGGAGGDLKEFEEKELEDEGKELEVRPLIHHNHARQQQQQQQQQQQPQQVGSDITITVSSRESFLRLCSPGRKIGNKDLKTQQHPLFKFKPFLSKRLFWTSCQKKVP